MFKFKAKAGSTKWQHLLNQIRTNDSELPTRLMLSDNQIGEADAKALAEPLAQT